MSIPNVLGTMSSVTYGAPESLLPHAKEEIKKAIELIVLLLSELDPTAQTTIEKLKIAYRELANFIPDEDAKLLAKEQGGFNSGYPSEIASEDAQRALNRFNQMSADSQALSSEFEDYLGALSGSSSWRTCPPAT